MVVGIYFIFGSVDPYKLHDGTWRPGARESTDLADSEGCSKLEALTVRSLPQEGSIYIPMVVPTKAVTLQSQSTQTLKKPVQRIYHQHPYHRSQLY